jgi:hypothetical protein
MAPDVAVAELQSVRAAVERQPIALLPLVFWQS